MGKRGQRTWWMKEEAFLSPHPVDQLLAASDMRRGHTCIWVMQNLWTRLKVKSKRNRTYFPSFLNSPETLGEATNCIPVRQPQVTQWWRIHLPVSGSQETRVQSLGQEDPLEEEMATFSSILAGKSHGQRSLEDYRPWGCKESDTTEHPCKHRLPPNPHRNNKGSCKCWKQLREEGVRQTWLQKEQEPGHMWHFLHNLRSLNWILKIADNQKSIWSANQLEEAIRSRRFPRRVCNLYVENVEGIFFFFCLQRDNILELGSWIFFLIPNNRTKIEKPCLWRSRTWLTYRSLLLKVWSMDPQRQHHLGTRLECRSSGHRTWIPQTWISIRKITSSQSDHLKVWTTKRTCKKNTQCKAVSGEQRF